jgi:hypothetical protein
MLDFGIEGIASYSKDETCPEWWVIMRKTGGRSPVVRVRKDTGEILDIAKLLGESDAEVH